MSNGTQGSGARWVDRVSRRWVGRAGMTAFVIAALAVGRVVGDAVPRAEKVMEVPHDVVVALGEPAELRTATITVDAVSLAQSVTDELGYTVQQTPGVYVVVEMTSTARDQPAGVLSAALSSADGSRTFKRSRPTLTCLSQPPGMTQTCGVALEIPPEELDGARLLLSTHMFEGRYDDQLVLPLGLTAADAEQAEELATVIPGMQVGADG